MAGSEPAPEPIRVLVVDDEADFAEALVSRLGRRGFAAEAVNTGEEGLRRAEGGGVDVLILDLRMPGMDGLEVLRRLRRTAPAVRVIVLTGHGTVASGIDGMQTGAADFLLKPADIETLSAAIVAAVGQAADEGAAAETGGAAS